MVSVTRNTAVYQSFIYSPTDALVSCLKKNICMYMYIKIYIYIKTAPDMFRCYGYTIIRERIKLVLTKVTVVKIVH